MKSNPARDLADILESWRAAGQGSVATIRATVSESRPYDHAFWVGIDRVAVLVDEYRRLIDSMDDEKAAIHRVHLPKLHDLIYGPNLAWNQSKNTDFRISDIELASLRLAADSLEPYLPNELQQSDSDAIVQHLQEALRLVAESLPDGVERDHLSRTILLAVQFAGDINRFGSDTARMATAAAVAGLEPLAERDAVPDEAKRRLGDICRDLLAAISANIVANYGTRGLDAGSEAVVKAITGGN